MSADVNDEVYFHKRGEPCSGKVRAVGKHGCTIEHGGKDHKVKWEHIVGHKKRAPQQYKVLEHGEDGLIAQNQHGQKKYFGIPPEARADALSLGPQKDHDARNSRKTSRASKG
jgi:hypothetical protein